jgi:hypothetical protein
MSHRAEEHATQPTAIDQRTYYLVTGNRYIAASAQIFFDMKPCNAAMRVRNVERPEMARCAYILWYSSWQFVRSPSKI